MPVKVSALPGLLYEFAGSDPESPGCWHQVASPQIVQEGRRTFSANHFAVTVKGEREGGWFEAKRLFARDSIELCGVIGEGLAPETPEEDEAIEE